MKAATLSGDTLTAIRRKARPAAVLLAEIDRLRNELLEAREDYRRCNLRVVEVLKDKIALGEELERALRELAKR